VRNLPMYPESAKRYYDSAIQYEAWRLLKDSRGRHFRSFDELCETAEPYGLGIPAATFRAYLVAVEGKRAVDLLTVAPDGRSTNRRGGKVDSSPEDTNQTKAHEKRLRAINRAPEAIRDLYKQSLIGQKEAAQLGPKDPEPEQAARIVEIAREAVAVSAAPGPAKAVQKRVNAVVRERLGAQPDPVRQACIAIRRVPADRLEEVAAFVADLMKQGAVQ